MRLPDLIQAARKVLLDPDIEDAELIDYANEALLAAADRVLMPGLEAAASLTVPAGATSVALPGIFHRGLFAAVSGDGGPLVIRGAGRAPDCLGNGLGRVHAVAAVGGELRVWPAPGQDEVLHIRFYRRPRTLEQQDGEVVFSAAANTMEGGLFARFLPGDVFAVSGSAGNNGSFTVVETDGTILFVAENLVDETAGSVNVKAHVIDGVPAHLHRAVLLNGMRALAFESKEDAFEGKKNADRFAVLAKQALRELKNHFARTGEVVFVPPAELKPRSLYS